MHGVRNQPIRQSMEVIAVTSNTELWDELVATAAIYAGLLSADLRAARAEDEIYGRRMRLRRQYRMNNITIYGYLGTGNRLMARAIERREMERDALNLESLERDVQALGLLFDDAFGAYIDADREERRISGLISRNGI